MFFDTVKAAREYAKDLTADMRGVHKHKAVACKQWRFDKLTGEYFQHDCFTVVLLK